MTDSSPALLLNDEITDTGLNDSQAVSCIVVHPLVLLSILDHHTRRQDGAGRVIGTLLGRRDGEKVEVTNCFAVPHAERDEEVAIGKDFNRQMLALHYRANRNETVVGWYATAFPQRQDEDNATDPHYGNRCLANTSSLIHEFYTGECEDSVMDSPIHLVVDTSLVHDAIALKGYISSAVTLNGEPLASMFHEVRLLLKSSESERIVMDEMIKAMGSNATSSTAVTATHHEGKDSEEKVAENINPLQVSLEKLLEMLDTASEYVGNVVSGKLVADDAVGNEIADTLSSIPRIRPEVFDKMFNESMQDLLMVSYLSKIT
eukprot:CAMPEP_0176482876 /NCGR_PEP_ID=MMETSP0200_2-20121128/3616_1 /TAXON_ID=947934 /ORGANISM="Chaetoceros sp., Strain GSL56" /LENGTH=317 /DNA_ID=CAMNT_0017879235 /DNA_START=92 /DNA_END=1041 /DNA_ORIENTATION=-